MIVHFENQNSQNFELCLIQLLGVDSVFYVLRKWSIMPSNLNLEFLKVESSGFDELEMHK